MAKVTAKLAHPQDRRSPCLRRFASIFGSDAASAASDLG